LYILIGIEQQITYSQLSLDLRVFDRF
jgi:hypothetical protein